MLSAFAHAADESALETAKAAVSGLESMTSDHERLYFDLILGALDDAVRRNLEEWMDSKHYEYKSDFARRYFAEGKAEGEAEGEAKGEAKGELAGARAGLFDVIRARGFDLDDRARERIESCRDIALLRAWISRAVVADAAPAVFDPPT